MADTPVRVYMTAELLDSVKLAAQLDGMTVSAWLRMLAVREIRKSA